MAASISPGAKRKIPVPDETGKFQEKSLDFSPKQGKYNTILEYLSIGRLISQKQKGIVYLEKWIMKWLEN